MKVTYLIISHMILILGYQNNGSQNSKAATNSNLLDFLSMSNPLVPSAKDVPPPPYTTTNSHPTVAANPDMSTWIATYGTSPVHNSFLNQNLSAVASTGAAAAERYHSNEHNKSNLNSIQPFLDSDLPVPNLDLFSSADTEKYLSMSM